MKPTILFLYNSSSYAVQPWIDDGRFNVVSVDYSDTDHSAEHRPNEDARHHRINTDLAHPLAKARVIDQLNQWGFARPSLVVSFAPCTDLAVSGARHFERKRQADPQFQDKAVANARLAETFWCAYAVENPVSVLASLWRKPDMYWHPCDFAGYCPEGPHPEFPEVIPAQDRYNKKSCLWVGNGFILPEVKRMEPPKQHNPGWVKLGGKSARTKYIRSLTPRGFAQAVYEANFGAILENHWQTAEEVRRL